MRILSPSLVSVGARRRRAITRYLPLCVCRCARLYYARTGWIASRSRVSESTKHFSPRSIGPACFASCTRRAPTMQNRLSRVILERDAQGCSRTNGRERKHGGHGTFERAKRGGGPQRSARLSLARRRFSLLVREEGTSIYGDDRT